MELNKWLEKDIDSQEDVEVLKNIAKAWKESCDILSKKCEQENPMIDLMDSIELK